jgi:hypothetical protein
VPLGNSYSSVVDVDVDVAVDVVGRWFLPKQYNIKRSIFGSRILNAKPANRETERKSGRLSVSFHKVHKVHRLLWVSR